MPKPWREVAQSREFLALDPEQRAMAREQYFSQVIAPSIPEPRQILGVKQKFEAETQPDIEFGQDMGQKNPLVAGLRKGLKTILPIESIGTLGKVGREPVSGGELAGAVADIGLSGASLIGAPGAGKAALKGMGAAGLTVGGMEALGKSGLPYTSGFASPVAQIPAAILAGGMTAARTGPKAIGPVPVGKEAGALAEMINESVAPGGVKMPIPGGSSPYEAQLAASALTSGTGERLGAAREAGIGASKATPFDVMQALGIGRQKAMGSLGVPVVSGQYRPELSSIPETAPKIIRRIGKAKIAGEMESGDEALKAAMNVVSGLKKTARKADVSREVRNLDASALREAAKQVDESILALIPKEQADVIRQANKDYAKAAQLEDLFRKASTGKAGPEPDFNPREVVFWWKNMKPRDRQLWNPEEQAAFEVLLDQKNPGAFRAVLSKVVGGLPPKLQDTLLENKWGRYVKEKGLSFNPRARFNRPYMPWISAQTVSGAGAPAVRITQDEEQ